MKDSFENLIEDQIKLSSEINGRNVEINQITLQLIHAVNALSQSPHDVNRWIQIMAIAIEGCWRNANPPNAIVTGYKTFLRAMQSQKRKAG